MRRWALVLVGIASMATLVGFRRIAPAVAPSAKFPVVIFALAFLGLVALGLLAAPAPG